MKKMNYIKNFTVLAFLAIFFAFTSCEKEETQNQGPDYGPRY